MNILVATNHLEKTGGTETYTYCLIKGLIDKGCNVEYFTFNKGAYSKKIEEELNISFKSKKKYDLVLANHSTCVRELYSYGYIIQTCHGIYPELEQPSIFADAYVAISKEVQDHLFAKGCSSRIIYNGIDTNFFFPKNIINKKLKIVFSLCQSQETNSFLQEVCSELGLSFKYRNKFKNESFNIQEEINNSDLVFGLGRSAYEAMSCGRPVIIYDHRPYSNPYGDGYLTKENLQNSLLNNCSGRFYKKQFSKEELKEELRKYNCNDSIYLREFIEKNMSISHIINQYLTFYKDSLTIDNINKGVKGTFDFLSKKYGKKIAYIYIKLFLKKEYYKMKQIAVK